MRVNRPSPRFGTAHSVYVLAFDTLRSMDAEAIARLIQEGIRDATVRVATDDNTHFQAVVVSDAFTGLRATARHQLVYRCLGELMGNEIHALSIRALTPDEWAASQS